MTAYELEQAAFDFACDQREETVKYIQDYADGAFDLYVSNEVAQKILDCRAAYKTAFESDGQYSLHHDRLIKDQLQKIKL